MKFKNVFWGLTLILLGGLLTARNFGLVDFNWFSFLRLWPLFIIIWGLSILPIREYIKIGVLIILLGGATWYVMESSETFHSPWDVLPYFSNKNSAYNNGYHAGAATADFLKNQRRIIIPYADTIQTAKLEMDAAAGEFKLSDTCSDLLSFFQKGTATNSYDYSVERNQHHVNILFSEKNSGVFHRSHHTEVSVALNPAPLWDIELNAGASSVKYDLSQFKVRKFSIDGGAGSFDIKLGDKYPNVKVNVETGASSLTIKIPENSGCKLAISSVFSGKHFPGFKKIKTGVYQTDNFTTAKNKIYFNVNAAVSSFRIIRY